MKQKKSGITQQAKSGLSSIGTYQFDPLIDILAQYFIPPLPLEISRPWCP